MRGSASTDLTEVSPLSRTAGSSASRMASPTRLKASTVNTIAAPGKNVSQGASRSTICPLLIMFPHVGVGSVTPRPRNDNKASVNMAVGICNVHNTISGSTAFSST